MTRTRVALLLAITLSLAAAPLPRPALADVAPPAYAQGGAVNPGEATTQVQMVSENVELVVNDKGESSRFNGLAANAMSALWFE